MPDVRRFHPPRPRCSSIRCNQECVETASAGLKDEDTSAHGLVRRIRVYCSKSLTFLPLWLRLFTNRVSRVRNQRAEPSPMATLAATRESSRRVQGLWAMVRADIQYWFGLPTTTHLSLRLSFQAQWSVRVRSYSGGYGSSQSHGDLRTVRISQTSTLHRSPSPLQRSHVTVPGRTLSLLQ